MYVVEGKESGLPASPYLLDNSNINYCWLRRHFPETPLGQFIASFVMILGYGIIAVPTGIVTAEIAKSTQNKIVTDKNHVLAAAQKIIQKTLILPSLWTFV
jgi:voltage-gated potassium channel